MKRRRGARRCAVQVLFLLDMNPGTVDEALKSFWTTKRVRDSTRAFAEELIRGVHARREEIDDRIRKHSENWDIRRMGGVDRNVLRLAVYEMMARPDIPAAVSINEAVDLAREFADESAGRFVNGILDRIRKELGRPARQKTDAVKEAS